MTLFATLAGCSGVRLAGGAGPPGELRAAVVRTARSLLGQRRLEIGHRALPPDCWALPVAAYGAHGLLLGGGDAQGLRSAAQAAGRLKREGRPRAGDLVFLREGPEVHVGLVERVDSEGTLVVLQRMARGVVAYRLNFEHPSQATSPDGRRPWNDRLEGPGRGESRLAGELYSGYAAFLP